MAVPTVASLCAALGHHLAPVPGGAVPELEVTAVHISELAEPGPYLSGGELLLTTGLVLPASLEGAQRYVARLQEARISALGFGVGPVHQAVPEVLVEACRVAGLPLLVVPGPTPFTMISRAYWKALSRETEERLTDAVAAHRALVEAAASPDPPAAILRRLAGVLDGWAVLLDAEGEVTEAHPDSSGENLEAMLVEAARLKAAGPHSSVSFTVAGHVVVLFPLAIRDRVVGYLAAGSPTGLDQSQRRVVVTAAALLSLEAMRGQRVESGREAVRRCLAVLLDLGQVGAARELAAVTGGPVLGQEVCVLIVRGRPGADLVGVVLRWCPEALAVRTGAGEAWFCVPAVHPDGELLADRLRAADAAAVALLTEPVGTGRLGHARTRAQRDLVALPPGCVLLPPRGPSGGDVRAAVESFIAQAPEGVLGALVGYLRCRGQWEPAARSLGLHRNTLRYRVRRAIELLGLDLDDPDVAAQTWLALRARGVA